MGVNNRVIFNAVSIPDLSISKNKIAPGAIDSSKIAFGGVTTTNIAVGAVTTNRIADGAVTSAKLDQNGIRVTSISIGTADNHVELPPIPICGPFPTQIGIKYYTLKCEVGPMGLTYRYFWEVSS